MATQNIDDLQRTFSSEMRASGIPRRGHFGAALSEFLLATLALAVLVLLACAFYYGSK
jgi:hypothetical protein